MFEVTKSDLAGRIGTLHTLHGRVQTPAFVPVIHPVKQTIPASALKKMGFELVITNAYITMKNYGQDAVRRGIHEIIGYDGAVMTDSGGYQVLEYGDVDADPAGMAAFEAGIKSDIAIPLDRPTGFGMGKKRAKQYVDHTLKVSAQTIQNAAYPGQIWAGPIQGGEHEDLVKRSARGLVDAGFEMMALGSPVEFMESYEYRLLAEMIAAAKRHVPLSSPMHLFGAGHPLTIPLAVALGCDTFDSASYMLYAKQGRYITEDGTRHISDMLHFACPCPSCEGAAPKEVADSAPDERTNRIALHNLYAIKSEVDRTKEAIHEGRLWEHAMKKARAHPRLYEAAGVLANNAPALAVATPQFKARAAFFYSEIDQYRPEAASYRRTVGGFLSKKKSLCIYAASKRKPAYLSSEHAAMERRFRDPESVQFCQYSPFLGLIPLEISDLYPAAHCVEARIRRDPERFPEFARVWKEFFARNRFDEVWIDKDDAFLAHFARMIPKGTKKKALKRAS